jgi:hypothetical protein
VAGGDLFKKWLTVSTPHQGVTLYTERPGKRAVGLTVLKGLVADHFVEEATILQAGGYAKAAANIINSLPSNKQTQSGDLGERLATEYLNAETAIVVPVADQLGHEVDVAINTYTLTSVELRQAAVNRLESFVGAKQCSNSAQEIRGARNLLN